MVNVAVLQRKLMRFRTALERLATRRSMTREAFLSDLDAQDIVCRNLQIAIQVCIDVSTHLIADSGWSPPRDLAGLVEILEARGVVDSVTAPAVRKAIGFRNVLVHEYDVVDLAIVYALWQTRVSDLARFMDQFSRYCHLDEPG